jgi:hypothetical protein
MAESISPIDVSAFIDQVTCEICHDRFNDPRLLPCGHSFCRACIKGWRKASPSKQLTCPKCRIVCKTNTSLLHKDLLANQILRKITLTESSDQLLSEEECGSSSESLSHSTAAASVPTTCTPTTTAPVPHRSCLKNSSLHNQAASRKISFGRDVEEKEDQRSTASRLASESTWSLVDSLHDDRVLSSGTNPPDSLKFWTAISQLQFERIVCSVKKQASSVEADCCLVPKVKSRRLEEAAMVLTDADALDDALTFCLAALQTSNSPSQQINIKVLLVYIVHCKLKQPVHIQRADTATSYMELIDLCDDVIETSHEEVEEGEKGLSEERLCKVFIIKGFTCHLLMRVDRLNKDQWDKLSCASLARALHICKSLRHDGLRAEVLMTSGLYVAASNHNDNGRKSIKLFKEALRLARREYGEFSVLCSRIYYNCGIHFEVRRMRVEAYECFRRTWLIDRQLLGANHPTTEKHASVLIDCYREQATKLHDQMPDDVDYETSDRDIAFTKRIKFLIK